MTEPKRNPNPFVRMAQEAKNKAAEDHSLPNAKKPETKVSVPKSSKGFGNKIIKKTGRA